MKKLWSLILTIVFLTLSVTTVFAQGDLDTGGEKHRLVDQADLLNEWEKEQLSKKLDEISERQQFDVVVVTVESLEGKSPMNFADDFYDYGGYGMGDDYDGALLLVCMGSRDWRISTSGFGIRAMTDAGMDYMSEQFLPYLSDGKYAKAFDTYATLCDEFVAQAKSNRPYDTGNMPKDPFEPGRKIFTSLAVGIVIALIVVLIMRGKMKTVQGRIGASDYIKSGSMVVNEKGDLFLYSHLHKERIERDSGRSSSGGGSSVHTSSSGRTHGGRGGKF